MAGETDDGVVKTTLRSLREWNEERDKLHRELNDPSPRRNGLACPKCGKEMLDAEPLVTLASYPPQKLVRCSDWMCDYFGYRVV
jgi:hypothetical protein